MGDSKKVKGLLSGIRVLDLADEKASFCPKIFADLGGQVIKVTVLYTLVDPGGAL